MTQAPLRSSSHFISLFLVLFSISASYSFTCRNVPKTKTRKSCRHPFISTSSVSMSASEEESSEEPVAADEEVQYESVVRINDGGSDLTDRFKYKVNALMGTYDPKPGTNDDEYANGNILNAMLNFPTSYTFTAVGKTNNDDDLKEKYVEMVKKVILDYVSEESGMECRVTPRGSKFTRISIVVNVQSSAMITGIYDGLEDIEGTVMKY